MKILGIARKTASILANLSLFLNTFLPFIVAAQPVYSQTPEEEPVEIVEATPIPEPTITIDPNPTEVEVSPTPTDEPFITPEPTITPEITPSIETTPSPTLIPSVSPEPEEVTPTPEVSDSPSNDDNATPTPEITPTTTPSVTVTPTFLGDTTGGVIQTSIVANNMSRTDTLNPTLSTDKDDYSPTEIAIITGTGFEVSTQYFLHITANELEVTYIIFSDENGEFTYSYQLDGTYRPDYQVEVKDGSGAVIASTSFTDSYIPTYNYSVDSSGVNDEPGQKDLTRMGVDLAQLPNNLYTTWQWDEISWSGNNTGDACNLFDTDNDNNANYALCISVGGSPEASYVSKTLYSCNDVYSDKCGGPVILPISANTTCNASVDSLDPFTGGDQYPKDTVGYCNINMSDIGGDNTNVNFLDVCSYPSQQPNSDPSDCVYTPTANKIGKLEVKKVLIPNNDSGLFNLQIDGVTYAANIGDSETTGEKELVEGTHTVGETEGLNTNLADYTSNISCRDNNGAGSIIASSSNSGPLNIFIRDKDDIVCTITNTKIVTTGTLKVIKQVNNNYGGTKESDDFTLSIGNTSFPGDSNGTTFTLNSGVYSVGETLLPGYVQTSNTCIGITISPNDVKECIIVNNDVAPKLTLLKSLTDNYDSGYSVTSWTLSAIGTGSSLVGTNSVSGNLLTGEYTLSETGPSSDSYTTSGWTCTGTGFILNGDKVTLSLGADVTCTVSNTTKPATLIVKKTVINDDGGTLKAEDFSFTVDGVTAPFNSSGQNSLSLNNGTYTVTEISTPGYKTTYKNCSNLIISNGQTATCEITNDDVPPVLKLTKTVINNNGGNSSAEDWNLTASGVGRTFTDTGDSTLFHPVKAGVEYTLTESIVAGYTPKGWICNGNDLSSNKITLGLGDSMTCTITNDDISPQLNIVKEIVPATDSGKFNLSIGGTQYATNIGHTGSTRFQNVVAGAVNFNETAGDNTSLSNYTTTYSQGCENGQTTLSVGETKICTITNTRNTGTIQIKKNVDLNGDGDYLDNGETDATDWQWQAIGPETKNGNTGSSAITVVTGDYILTETNKPNFHQVNLNCIGGTLINNTVTITKGSNVVCTFINARDVGSLTAHKFEDNNFDKFQQIDTENNLSNWEMSLYSGNMCVGETLAVITTDSMGNANFGNLATGTYSVKETLQNGWRNSTNICQSITITKDTHSTIVFGNQKLAKIIIEKQTLPDENPQLFEFNPSWSRSNFRLKDNQTYESGWLTSGTYYVDELNTSGWKLSDLSCDDSNSGVDPSDHSQAKINLEAGETVHCTFTNTKLGSITIKKETLPNHSLDIFSYTGTLGTHTLFDGDTDRYSNLNPGAYTFTESNKDNWYLKDLVCDSGLTSIENRTATINLTPGQNVTCTFTNAKYGQIDGIKFNDKDGDNRKDIIEPILKDWQIFIDSNNNQQLDVGETSTVTNILGVYSFKNLLPGDYTVCEVMQSGWYATTGILCQTTTINENGGDIDILNFANQQYGSATVHKFNDLNHDGVLDVGETGLSGWTINLYSGDSCQGQVVQNGSQVSDSQGNVTFADLIPGTYSVQEYLDPDSDWMTTTPVCQSFTISPGQITNTNIGNIELGHVSLTKFNDANGNGIFDEGETAMSGWNLTLSDIGSSMTGTNGSSLFNRIYPGIYDISEDNQPGWTQTNIYCEDSSGVKITSSGEAYGHHGACSGWNACGDAATCALWACEVNGYSNLVSYGESKPCTQFNNCNLFNYRGSVQYNWGNWCGVMGVTDIICSNSSSEFVSDNPGQVTVEAGKTKVCYIGNQRLEPKMTISKINSTGGTILSPGDSVDYTITLNFIDNSINNLQVTDLLSDGFKYRSTSYQVLKNGSDVTAQVGEPQYHSPGLWNLSSLGSLTPEDEIVLAYTADISTDQQAGEYPDLAYASAVYGYDSEQSLLATANPEGYIDTNFVGTDVTVNRSNQNSVSAEVERTETIEGQVLGASTELPSTGAATLWLIISSLLGALGLIFIKHDKISTNMAKKIFSILILPLFLFVVFGQINSVWAADLSIRLMEPKTPTNIKSLQLKFVVLDLSDSGSQITVKCLKKGPVDSDFSQYGSDITLSAGGNASQCEPSSIIDRIGDYQFKVSANGFDSNIISLNYNDITPGTPTSYSKEKVSNNCDFKIYFRTADDQGRTVKVELYRSTDSAFSVNAESLVDAVGIGSTQEYVFSNSVPDCSKTYYYAIRAFDSAGNGSGVIGDTITVNTVYTETTITGTPAQGAIPVNGGNISPDDGNREDQSEISSQDTDNSTGQILGTQTKIGNFITNHKILSIIIGLAILAIIIYVFRKLRQDKKFFFRKRK